MRNLPTAGSANQKTDRITVAEIERSLADARATLDGESGDQQTKWLRWMADDLRNSIANNLGASK